MEAESEPGQRKRVRKRVRVKVKATGGWQDNWPVIAGVIAALIGAGAMVTRWFPGLTLSSFFAAWAGFVIAMIAYGVRSMRGQTIRYPGLGVGVCLTAILLELLFQRLLPPDLANPRREPETAVSRRGEDSDEGAEGTASSTDLLEQMIRKDREDALRFERSLPALKSLKNADTEQVVHRQDDPEAIEALTRREFELDFDALLIQGESRRAVVGVRKPDAAVSDNLLLEIAPHLANLPNLRTLELPRGQLTQESLAKLEPSTALRRLILPRASDVVLSHIVRFPRLESLEFTDRDQLTDRGMESIATLRELVTLDLGVAPRRTKALTDAGLALLAPLSSLQTLKIPHAGITGSGLAGELFLVRLKRLDLSFCDIDDEKLPLIGKFDSLESLRLRGSQLTGSGLGALRQNTRLRQLDLSQTESLKSVHLSALVELEQLEELILSECPLEEDVARILPQLTSLQFLDVSNTPLPKAVGERLQTDLPNCRIVFGADFR